MLTFSGSNGKRLKKVKVFFAKNACSFAQTVSIFGKNCLRFGEKVVSVELFLPRLSIRRTTLLRDATDKLGHFCKGQVGLIAFVR